MYQCRFWGRCLGCLLWLAVTNTPRVVAQDTLPPLASIGPQVAELAEVADRRARVRTLVSQLQAMYLRVAYAGTKGYLDTLQRIAQADGMNTELMDIYDMQVSLAFSGGEYEKVYHLYLKPYATLLAAHDPSDLSVIRYRWRMALMMALISSELGRNRAGLRWARRCANTLPAYQDWLQQQADRSSAGQQTAWVSCRYHRAAYSTLTALGSTHLYLGQFDSARIAYDSCLYYAEQLLDTIPAIHQQLQASLKASTYDNLGLVSTGLGEYETALTYHRQALQWLAQGPELPEVKANIQLNLAETYQRMGNHTRALALLRESLAAEQRPFYAVYMYLPMAQIFLQQQQLDSALRYSQAAINSQADQAAFAFPPTKTFSIQALRLDFRLVTALIYQAQAWTMRGLAAHVGTCPNEIHLSDQEKMALQQAHATNLLLVDVLDSLRRVNYYDAEDGGYELADTVAVALKRAVRVAYQLGQALPEQQARYVAEALRFSEAGKYNLLYYAWRQAELDRFSGLPDSLLALEGGIQRELLTYQNALFGQGEDTSETDSLRHLLAEVEARRSHLLADLQQHYPGYYQVKYRPLTWRVAEMREQLLGPHQAIFEYVAAEDAMYVFALTSEDLSMDAVCRDDSLHQSLLQVKRAMSNPMTAEVDVRDQHTSYLAPAHLLYRKLLAPLLSRLPATEQQPWHVCVVADGPLRSFNLGALITQLPKAGQEDMYHTWAFLAKDQRYVFSYEKSLTVALGRKSRSAAPPYAGDYYGLAGWYPAQPLDSAWASVQRLQALGWSGGSNGRLGTEDNPLASSDWLRTVAQQQYYRILHLAMHGQADFTDPNTSGLAFSDSDTLTAADIYALYLPAELVVLDACETGLGLTFRGEGVMSLSRAFAYAGASSMLISQWSIDDGATQVLVEHFLEQIRAGKPKDLAWRAAQAHFFRTWQGGQHPYYWAGLMPIGDMSPLSSDESSLPWWIWPLGIGLGAVVVVRMIATRFGSRS